MRTKNTISAADIQNIGRWRRTSQASVPSVRAFSPLAGALSGPSGPPLASMVTGTTEVVSRAESRVVSVMGDPRIQEAVEDVDDEVDQKVDQHQAESRTHNRCAVLLTDAAVEEVADAVDVEDSFGDDCAAHQRADVNADESDDRDQGVAQGVYPDRAPIAQALGLGGSHIVGPQVLAKVGPHQPSDVGQRGRGQDEGGHDQLIGGSLGSGDREPAEADPEDQLGEAPDYEDGDRDQEQRAYRDQVVDELPTPNAGEHTRRDA